jgi:hypothetical protein
VLWLSSDFGLSKGKFLHTFAVRELKALADKLPFFGVGGCRPFLALLEI